MLRRFAYLIYPNQLRTLFEWLSGIVREADVVVVEKNGRDAFYRFPFPLRLGDMPRRSEAGREEATFVVRLGNAERHLPGASSTSSPQAEWARIFSSPEVAVFEKKSRATGPAPLRWGLSEEEKRRALRLARAAVADLLRTGEKATGQLRGLPPRFSLRADVDVAFWVRGALRGSQIVEGRALGDGIAEASCRASRDPRFKPLEQEDLPALRIQVTVLHDLHIPLSRAEKTKNAIYAEKGYRLEREGRAGWYLPEVLNVRRFRGLNDFLGDLAEEKAGLARASHRNAGVFIFEVDDFIESADRSGAVCLFGPVVKNKLVTRDSGLTIQRLRSAADWLCRIQEPDGNIPAVLDPLTGQKVQIDWPRLAFTAFALSEFGAASGKEEYRSAAQKAFAYLEQHLFAHDGVVLPHRELPLAYFGQLALSLGERQGAERAAEELLGRLDTSSFEPILYSQAATFFIRSKNRAAASRLLGALQSEFLGRQNSPRSLATWAEAAHAAFLYSRTGREDSFGTLYKEVKQRLLAHQLENGAFPDFPGSRFAYTRGTGKIFEVLALEPEANRAALLHSLRWLFSMHYSEDAAFFVPERFLREVIGGFRHDELNHEAWIDAAGHVLLGTARILCSRQGKPMT